RDHVGGFPLCAACTRRHQRSVSAFLLNRSTDLLIATFMVNSGFSRERSGINTILHELNPLFTINVTMRDIKSKNVYSRVNSKAKIGRASCREREKARGGPTRGRQSGRGRQWRQS